MSEGKRCATTNRAILRVKVSSHAFQYLSISSRNDLAPWLLQEEAKRVAEQMRALEGTRERMTADLGAREAALSQREDAAVAAARKREDDLRRRGAQDEQVCSASPSPLNMLALSVQA